MGIFRWISCFQIFLVICHNELHFAAKCSAVFVDYSLNINSIVPLELMQVCCVKEGQSWTSHLVAGVKPVNSTADSV